MSTDPLDGRDDGMDTRPFTLPCCTHQTKLDALVRALALSHGRTPSAERVAWGLDHTPETP